MEKKTTNKTPKTKVAEPKKSAQKLSFDEFFTGKDYRRERKAAFKMSLGGKLYHFEKEWQKKLKEFEGLEV